MSRHVETVKRFIPMAFRNRDGNPRAKMHQHPSGYVEGKDYDALLARLEIAESMCGTQHEATDAYVKGLETRVKVAEGRAAGLAEGIERVRDQVRSRFVKADMQYVDDALSDLLDRRPQDAPRAESEE